VGQTEFKGLQHAFFNFESSSRDFEIVDAYVQTVASVFLICRSRFVKPERNVRTGIVGEIARKRLRWFKQLLKRGSPVLPVTVGISTITIALLLLVNPGFGRQFREGLQSSIEEMTMEVSRLLLLMELPGQGVPPKPPLCASVRFVPLHPTIPDTSPTSDQDGGHGFGSGLEPEHNCYSLWFESALGFVGGVTTVREAVHRSALIIQYHCFQDWRSK
jgi:hypothetical protein